MDTPPPQPPLPGGLTSREWLCILPAPVSPRGELGERDPADPAARARQDDPLSPAAALTAAAADPLLRRLTHVSFALAPLAARGVLRVALSNITAALLAGFLWTNGRDQFGQAQIAATTAVFVMEVFGMGLGVPLAIAAAGGDPRQPQPAAAHKSGILRAATLDAWPEAGFWRYRRLAASSESAVLPDGKPLLLLEHFEGDQDCCCPRPTCAGPLAARSAQLRLLLLLGSVLYAAFYILAKHYTFWVTLGPQLWTSPWAVLGALAVANLFINEGVSFSGGSVYTDNVAVRELDRRLQLRTVQSALVALVDHFRGMVDSGTNGPATDAEHHYAEIVPLLRCRWQQDDLLPQMAAASVAIVANALVGIVVYVSTGSCIPAYTLGFVGIGLLLLAYVLTNAVIGNARIVRTSSLLLSASLSLRKLLSSLESSPPSPAGDRLARRLAAHADVLDRLADVRGAGARLLGAPVTAGLARRLLAGALTAGFAAWTVLRATEVVVTIQCVCPSQGADAA